MKEISKLFETNEIEKIKELLEKIIKKIEKEERQKQNLLLEELVKKAQQANEKLRKKYQVIEGLYV